MAIKIPRLLWRVVWSLLLVLLGASLAVWFTTGWFWWLAKPNVTTIVQASDNTPTIDSLNAKLADLEKRADDMERMATFLLGLSTIYAVALGLGAYAQLKDSANNIENLRSRAEEKINQFPKDLECIRKEANEDIEKFFLRIQAKFPMFADMDVAIRNIMQRLTRLLPIIDPSLDYRQDKYYRALTPESKEKILFWEKTTATFEYFDLQCEDRRTASEIYHGFGNFYGLRYALDGKQPEDRDRSRFYLDLAIRYDPRNSGALNDRGFLALDLEDSPDYVKAKDCFEDSLQLDQEQQRARYNLAYIYHQRKEYASAISLLSEALGKKHWQRDLPARYRPSILYNRACAYAQFGNTKSDAGQKNVAFDKAIEDLRTLEKLGLDNEPKIHEYFAEDIGTTGDLHALTFEQPWSDSLKGLTLFRSLPKIDPAV